MPLATSLNSRAACLALGASHTHLSQAQEVEVLRALRPGPLPAPQGGSALQAAPLQPQVSLDAEPTPLAPGAATGAGGGARRTGMSADVKNLQLATGGGKRCGSLVTVWGRV